MKEEKVKSRPHHRAIMLTVSKEEYKAIKDHVGDMTTVMIQPVNDIIRTSRCGMNSRHHWERRIATVRAAIRGGWPFMKVRHSGGCKPLRVKVTYLFDCKDDLPCFDCSVIQMEA